MSVWIEGEFADGYFDGRNTDTPEPSGNRSRAYQHSWGVGRAERLGHPIPAAISRAAAAIIEAEDDQPLSISQ